MSVAPHSGSELLAQLADIYPLASHSRSPGPSAKPSSKVDLLCDAAHELRSPLAYIKGYGELIASGRIDETDLRRIGERIRLQASRLSETVDDILELARIEAHRGANFKLRLHPITQLMSDALDALGPERSERIEIRLPSDSIPPLWVDRSKLCRALLNVFDNACKYSPGDTPITVRIGVRGGASGVPTRVSVHVRDHGLGMERADAQRAFERFFRAESVSALPGSGLGLAITEQIIRLHRGRLSLHSRRGIGTIISILLPVGP